MNNIYKYYYYIFLLYFFIKSLNYVICSKDLYLSKINYIINNSTHVFSYEY